MQVLIGRKAQIFIKEVPFYGVSQDNKELIKI